MFLVRRVEGKDSTFHRKKTRESNENMWDAAECGDAKKIRELLDPQRQLYPAEIDSRYANFLVCE